MGCTVFVTRVWPWYWCLTMLYHGYWCPGDVNIMDGDVLVLSVLVLLMPWWSQYHGCWCPGDLNTVSWLLMPWWSQYHGCLCPGDANTMAADALVMSVSWLLMPWQCQYHCCWCPGFVNIRAADALVMSIIRASAVMLLTSEHQQACYWAQDIYSHGSSGAIMS